MRRTVEDYRKRAQEALDLAHKARESERPIWLNVAQVWARLAAERQSEIPKLKAASLLSQAQGAPGKH
jgi:hypothetical protein